LTISSVVANGDFSQSNNCGGGVTAGGGCAVTVTFTPASTGSRSGALTIVDNAAGSPHVVLLSGTGNFPPLASFASQCSGLTCSFNGSASSDPDGTIAGFVWRFGDGADGSGPATVGHTYAVAGTYIVTLTSTDNVGATASKTAAVTATSTSPPAFMHVGDLDGAATTDQKNTWMASVAVVIDDSSHNRVAGATVIGGWSSGGTSTCTTNGGGQCTVSKSGISRKTGSATFTVSSVTQSSLTYQSADNHDSDGDSNGTSIMVNAP
jgi:PKD repeat protein